MAMVLLIENDPERREVVSTTLPDAVSSAARTKRP